MSHVQFTDELVREYLLFRGFGGTLKSFDAELKIDKDKGFRVDKIVDQLLQHVYSYDLVGLREAWNHFDTRIFSRLEHYFASSVRKLENSVLKFYLVNASENNKQDKIMEFFNKLTNELTTQIEWKDWFVFPFIKNPEEHAVFSVYFTRQWQDTLLVSLHNFLAAVYQCMPQPTLSSFEENATKMVALQKENDIMRKGLVNLINEQEKVIGSEPSAVQGFEGIMDDFFNLSQEIKENENQARILKTIIRNISSMPPSPKSENKEQTIRNSHRKNSVKKAPQAKRSLSIDARPTHLRQRERDSSLDLTTARSSREIPTTKKEEQTEKVHEGNFLFLSREEYNEHKNHITCIKFNNRGNLVASADVEGNLKVWSFSPYCRTIASFSSKHKITCLDWVPPRERFIICGTSNGIIYLYDNVEVKPVWSMNLEDESSTPKRIDDIVSSPVDLTMVAIVSGKLLIIDLKTRKVEKNINIVSEGTCAKINHNGQFAMVGTQEGSVLLVDLRKNEVLDKWMSHQSPVCQLEVTLDYTFIYSFARDKIHCRSLNQTKSKGLSITIPEEMKTLPEHHGRLFCLDATGTLILAVGVNSGVIFKVSESSLVKCLELGGHKTMVTCVDWSFANQCATCVTASQDGKIKISTLLLNSL